MKDFFISYNSHDRERAEWIAYQLEEAGYSTIIQAWDFRPGRSFPRLMQQALDGSKRVIAVLSQHYIEAEFTHPEWEAAFLTDPTGSEGGLIPARVSRCKVPKMLRRLIYIDLVDIAEEEAKRRLLAGVREGRFKPGSPPPFTSAKVNAPPAEARRIFHVPFSRNTFFTGREEVLEELHRRLRSEGGAALSQVEAISGLGGIGKTQTALEYAYRHRDEYQAVLWARAESEESLTSAFAEIAGVLELPQQDAQAQALAVAAVKRWLGERSNWLLILDNADSPKLVEGFLPTDHKGFVLVTSRAGVFDSLGIAQPLRMRKMPADEAQRFLHERTGRSEAEGSEAEAVRDLAKELGYLPLALEQAAAYVLRIGCTFQTYLESFRIRGLELLERQGPVAGDYPESVRTTWSLNIEQAAQQSEASVEVLKLSAFLAPDVIPLELLVKGAQEIGPAFAALVSEQDGLSVEEALQPLSQYSLIQREPGSGSYSIHRMVQTVVQAAIDEDKGRQWAIRTVMAVNKAFPEVRFEDWGFCERLTPHAQCCMQLVETIGIEAAEAGRLLNQLGEYLRKRGIYRASQSAHERALAIREKALGSEHPLVATSLNNLALAHQDQGDYRRALPLHGCALAICEKALGPEHPLVATSLNNLALLHHWQGDHHRGLPLCERALAIFEKALDPEHPDVATSLNNLALLYQDQGDYRRALPLCERALAIWEKALGPEHPDVANSLNNLALLYQDQGDYRRALPLSERALVIREKALGPEHPDVAASLNNLGSLYMFQGDYRRALPVCERAQALWEKVLGTDHPDVALSLNNLALLHLEQGNYSRALPLLKRALALAETKLGPEHPLVAAILIKLVKLYRSQGNHDGALRLCRQALTILEKAIPGHPNLAKGLENSASLLEEMGRLDEAKEMKARAKRIRDEHARKNPKTGE